MGTWTEEVKEALVEFQPGKIFPVPKRAFVSDEGIRVEASGGVERGPRGFAYKGRDIEFKMLGRLVEPYPLVGELTFRLEPNPYWPISRFVAIGKLTPQDRDNIPLMKQDIAEAFQLLPRWLHLAPELSLRPIRIEFDGKFDT